MRVSVFFRPALVPRSPSGSSPLVLGDTRAEKRHERNGGRRSQPKTVRGRPAPLRRSPPPPVSHAMLRYEAMTMADPRVAWALIAEPARWHEWAPQISGAWGLGEPEVEADALGAVRVLGALPVRALIERVSKTHDYRHWVWKVGLVRLDHSVRTVPGGCLVAIELRAPRPLEWAVRASYGPLVRYAMNRLATVATRESWHEPPHAT